MKTKLTCPNCKEMQEEEVPSNACVPFYVCKSCKKTVQAKADDCCIFCSYGSEVCPLKKQNA